MAECSTGAKTRSLLHTEIQPEIMLGKKQYFASVGLGMAALQSFYNFSTGLWDTTGWWHAANAMSATIDYSAYTNTLTYRTNIFHTFERYKNTNFYNKWFYDDDGWWALTWIKAYDLTGETRYLEMSKTIFKNMQAGWDSKCGGGMRWKKGNEPVYKNAITNELFLAVAVRLHLRTPGDRGSGSYLDWAQRTWTWFKKSGMINSRNLVNDGLNDACKNNGQTTWTYNQGVLLGGLVDLYKATNDTALLEQAEAIANSAITHLAPKGILREPCELDCGEDGAQFKGVFIRNLHYLYQVTKRPRYREFILRNANSIWAENRNDANQFGLSWAGKFDQADASRQSSAMDALNAAFALSRERASYRSENRALSDLSANAEGSGVDRQDKRRSRDQFVLTAPAAGRYTLTFRYAAAEGTASRYITVNQTGIVNNQTFPPTESWTQSNSVSVRGVWLNAGENTIAVNLDSDRGSQNGLLLEELTLSERLQTIW
ncbi:MAG TPA: glycoside hydrolase family 76 protein [Thermosynechococcaceae cyanobacterium]